MWFLQIDTLGLIALFTVLCHATLLLFGKTRGRKITPYFLAPDLLLLCYVSKQLALFYVVYVICTYALVMIVYRAGRYQKMIFVAASVAAVLPFFYLRLQPFFSMLPPFIVVIGISYNMLKAVDAVFYVHYAGERISFWAYANYILFFPVITAGPIFRFRDFIRYYESPELPDLSGAVQSVKRIIIGMFKKTVLLVFLQKALEYLLSCGPHWYISTALVFLSYAILYFDLSGYSDIAIGFSALTGIPAPENFKSPLKSATFTQFWRRWHVTLSDWIREHIFVVVSGKRLSRKAGALVGFGTMVIMSLWHSFGISAVLCGSYLGVLLAIENIAGKTTINARKTPKWRYALHCVAVTFLFGVNAMYFTMDSEKMLYVVKGFFRL